MSVSELAPGSRAEREAIAAGLRAEGLLLREIAERMGVSTTTVDSWLNDPGGYRLKARKRSYAGRCVDCSARTNGYAGPGKASRRCQDCASRYQHESAFWTREAIVGAIQAFCDRYGRLPAATDWNPSQARKLGHFERVERYHSDGCWPAVSTVQLAFGTWNAAVSAAGMTPRRSGCYDRNRGAL